jgi:hypothetical protein
MGLMDTLNGGYQPDYFGGGGGALGAAASAFPTNTQQSGTSSGTSTNTSNALSNQFSTTYESPLLTQFRNGLFPFLTQQLQQSTQPVFTDATKASFLSNVNGLANSSINSLNNNLAKRGISNSGAYAAGATDIGNQRNAQLTNFYSQLPFQERQAQANLTNPLLTMGLNFAGRGPTSTFQTGSNVGNQFSQNFSTNTSSTHQSQSPWAGLLGAAGGFLSML